MTRIDTEKFRSLTQNGVWPVTSEGYNRYVGWLNTLKALLDRCDNKFKYSSSLNYNTSDEYRDIINYCRWQPEMAVHSITYLMMQESASWLHLTLLYELTGHRNLPEHAGKFYSQIAMWLLYYDNLRYGND